MPDLELELDHLELANKHLASGEKLIAHLEQLVSEQAQRGGDTSVAQDSLQLMRHTLVTFHEHRDQILKTIDDISKGVLPGAP